MAARPPSHAMPDRYRRAGAVALTVAAIFCVAGGALRVRRETMTVALNADESGWGEVQSMNHTVDDCMVHYYYAPAEGDCRGAVLLLHGGSYEAKTWISTGTMSALAKGGFEAYAIDEPGHGSTVGTPTTTNSVFLKHVLSALWLEKEPIILSASAGGYYSDPYVAKELGGIGAYVPVATAGATNETYKWSTIQVPTLFIYGSDDQYGIGQADRPLFEEMPNETTYEMMNASHACYLDDNAAFNERVLQFLSSLDRDLECGAYGRR